MAFVSVKLIDAEFELFPQYSFYTLLTELAKKNL